MRRPSPRPPDPPGSAMFKDILFPVDVGDEASWQRTLPAAIDICRSFGAALHVITVVPEFKSALVAQFFPEHYEESVRVTAQEKLHQFTQQHVPEDIPRQHILAVGTVYRQILAAAERISADLIIIGAHHAELEDYLLGTNTARVVRHAECSVLVVRA